MTPSLGYRICGLDVVSDLELIGAIRTRSQSESPDVVIRHGSVPTDLHDATETGPDWQMAGSKSFIFNIPRLARFLVARGSEITVDIDQETTERDVSAFVLGTAFGVLLHQRGMLVLHGAAVAKDGRAIAICGESGAGKSTLASALCRGGFSFVTDDLCVVARHEAGHPVVLPDGRKLKLWKESIEKLDLAARQGEVVRQPFEKYYIEPFDTVSEPPVLSAVFVLREAPSSFAIDVVPLALPDAMKALECEMYRPALREKMGLRPELIAHAAAAVAHAKVFLLGRRPGFEHLDETVALLQAHWNLLEI